MRQEWDTGRNSMWYRWVVRHPWSWVIVRPREFFRQNVLMGDQASGLFFAMGVVLVAETVRFWFSPELIPDVTQNPLVSGLILLGVAVLLVTPIVLHLVAALQTLLLVPVVPHRAPVSETVQVFAYGAAPCVLVGLPSPELRLVACGYGAYLVLLGLSEIHGISVQRALVAGVVPVFLVFGYGFGGVGALLMVLSQWYII